MTDAAAAHGTAQADAPPPFAPDPELIDHLEGNDRAIGRYRKRAEQMRAAARDRQSPTC